jgi:hypothetical protein
VSHLTTENNKNIQMKNHKINATQVLFTLALVSLIGLSSAYGQSELEDLFGFDNTNVNDVPEAPIHFLVYAGMLVGTYLGFNKLKQ